MRPSDRNSAKRLTFSRYMHHWNWIWLTHQVNMLVYRKINLIHCNRMKFWFTIMFIVTICFHRKKKFLFNSNLNTKKCLNKKTYLDSLKIWLKFRLWFGKRSSKIALPTRLTILRGQYTKYEKMCLLASDRL